MALMARFSAWPITNTRINRIIPGMESPSMLPILLNTVEITLVASPKASRRE